MKAPHTGPVLSCCWSAMGDKIFTGSADKTGKAWDLNTQQSVQFAAHDAPIKSVHFVEQHNMVVTASWDKTLKYWPLNTLGQGTPAATVNLSERECVSRVRVRVLDLAVPASAIILRRTGTCVCVCVCVCVCACVCVCVTARARANARTHTHTHTCMWMLACRFASMHLMAALGLHGCRRVCHGRQGQRHGGGMCGQDDLCL